MNGIETAHRRRQRFTPAAALFLLIAGAAVITAEGGHGKHCNCNPGIADAEVVEWDLPSPVDTSSGAITLDVQATAHGRLWFVSRVGEPKLYKLDPGRPIKSKNASWTSWELNELSLTTGGLFRIKTHKNQREVFVRTHTSLQRIDTGECTSLSLMESCQRTTWFDQISDEGPDMIPHVSDLSSDDCNIYTTTAIFDNAAGVLLPGRSYLQQLVKCRIDTQDGNTGTTTVKRWTVGGGAGFCEAAVETQPCISGVSVDPRREYLVYFAQPGSNEIGELDVRTNNVRRWSLSMLGADVFEPRQVEVDKNGVVWTVTGSGHLVRLDSHRNRMSKHQMPAGALADPFGVAPDHGVVGYTASASDQNKVAMLFPKGNMIYVAPSSVCIQPTEVSIPFIIEEAAVTRGVSPPMRKIVHAQITDKPDGVFIEGQVSDGGSFLPLGITPDLAAKLGTYIYAVGLSDSTFNRIGQIVLPTKHQKHGHARDDDDHDRDGKRNDHDDDDDDDGKKDDDDEDDDNDCVDDEYDDDDDNDGIPDKDDDQGKREGRDTRHDEVETGQAAEYDMDVDSTNLILATTVTSLDPTSLLSVEVYDPAGQLVASPPPTPGVALATVPTLTAGRYKVRVKNLGESLTGMTTEFLTRGAWPLDLFEPVVILQ